MSDNQTSATVERGRPTSRQEQPHFHHIQSIAYSSHEQAVLDAGYPWVRTNMLIPTWASPDADPRSNLVPDRLHWHGHHGVNTHLIVEGDITLMKLKKMFGQNHISAVTMSTDLGAPKEAPVAPDEVYGGTTQQACKFVEGHRNLSPMSAHRVRISKNHYAPFPGQFRISRIVAMVALITRYVTGGGIGRGKHFTITFLFHFEVVIPLFPN